MAEDRARTTMSRGAYSVAASLAPVARRLAADPELRENARRAAAIAWELYQTKRAAGRLSARRRTREDVFAGRRHKKRRERQAEPESAIVAAVADETPPGEQRPKKRHRLRTSVIVMSAAGVAGVAVVYATRKIGTAGRHTTAGGPSF